MAGLSAARKAAFITLCSAREREAYVRELVNAPGGPIAAGRLSPEDRNFAARLALGTVAAKGTLDECIDRFASHPEHVDPDVRDVLRIATYEMLFLGKSPHVAVSQGVELVKLPAKSATGFVNAVLRRVSENGEAFMAESTAHRCGLPAWLLDRVAQDLGTATAESFALSYLEPAPLYLASNPLWINDRRAAEAFAAAGLAVEPAGGIPGAWLAVDPSKVASCKMLEEVQAIVADYGAQCVAYLAAPQVGDRFLEVGSGRGTKTLLMAGHVHRQQGGARIWALDIHPYKAPLAAQRLEKGRVVGVTQVTGDARRIGSIRDLPPAFDGVLVDAPCTGSGTLRRHPEIAWSLRESDVASCARLQLEMLRSAAGSVAAGGKLTYATCSVLRAENEDVVAAFLGSPEGAGFEVVHVADIPQAGAAVDEMSERSTPEGFFRTCPQTGSCDGHFCAVLRKA